MHFHTNTTEIVIIIQGVIIKLRNSLSQVIKVSVFVLTDYDAHCIYISENYGLADLNKTQPLEDEAPLNVEQLFIIFCLEFLSYSY